MNKHEKVEKTKQLNLKDNETYELAAKVARYHDESLNDAVKTALRQRHERDMKSASKEERLKKVLPVLQNLGPANCRSTYGRRNSWLRRKRLADVIAVDTSAIVAIYFDEPEAALFLDLLASDGALIPVTAVLESSIVARAARRQPAAEAEQWLDSFLADMQIGIVPIDTQLLSLARGAHLRYGKGTGHPAQLNFGDCFSYALAKSSDVPLLYKGSDFARTDIHAAL